MYCSKTLGRVCRWLVSRGRSAEAREALLLLRRPGEAAEELREAAEAAVSLKSRPKARALRAPEVRLELFVGKLPTTICHPFLNCAGRELQGESITAGPHGAHPPLATCFALVRAMLVSRFSYLHASNSACI